MGNYHVVKILNRGIHQNYHIYKDNIPFLVPVKNQKLKKLAAYCIVRLLNYLYASNKDS